MRPLHNIYISCKKFFPILALALMITSCDTSEVADCFEGFRLRVVVSTSENQTDPNWMGEGIMEDVMLYIFDENELLIDMFQTEIGKTELLYYSQAKTLHVVSTANVDNLKMSVTETVPGVTTLKEVEIALKKADSYLGYQCYQSPTDVFSGKISVENRDYENIIDLPIGRRTAAVMVRVVGLKDYINEPGADDDDFTVVLETKYNKLNLPGIPEGPDNGNLYPVPYKLTGVSRTEWGSEYTEFPAQISPDRTDYIRTISTDGGSAVSVSIYYEDQLVAGTPVTQLNDGSPILVMNDLLNVIQIDFRNAAAAITITVKQASWNNIIPIEKEFGF